ncbi:nascent polypeptide-associated complex subunit beta-like protein [Tanacetum coccineum]
MCFKTASCKDVVSITPSHKKEVVHNTTTIDVKSPQSTLKRIGVNGIPSIKEGNILNDETVIQFLHPKVHASIATNIWVVSGTPQRKSIKKKALHTTTDYKTPQNTLKRIGVNGIPTIEEVKMLTLKVKSEINEFEQQRVEGREESGVPNKRTRTSMVDQKADVGPNTPAKFSGSNRIHGGKQLYYGLLVQPWLTKESLKMVENLKLIGSQ